MPCFRPIEVPKRGYADLLQTVACGRCIGCRLEKTRQWSHRCVQEASLHEENSFVTLTYAPEKLPTGGTLDKSHFQLFMKRLRKNQSHRDEFGNHWYRRIKFFAAGEYGDTDGRPHYHAILFNFWPPDARLARPEKGSQKALYTSKLLDEVWGLGFCWIGRVTFASAGYTARYIVKKVGGDLAESHYKRIDPDTGEVHQLLPEFGLMSRRPGIGHDWFHKFQSDCYPSDFLVANGKITGKPPAYYDKLLRRSDPEEFERIKQTRLEKFNDPKVQEQQTPARLAVREEVKTARINLKKRDLT